MNLQLIESKILELRKLKVILDFDLSTMYEVETRVLKQAVKRNKDRFPNDFMFQLTESEWNEVITNCDNLPKNIKFSPVATYAFTEQGIAMLSSVLKSKKALHINIAIMRTFVFIRQYAITHKDLTEQLKSLETKYNKQFTDIFQAIHYLINKDKLSTAQKERKKVGFK